MMADIYDSIDDFYSKMTHNGFERHGDEWVYRKRLDRSSRWDNWFDSLASRKIEGKPQYFEVRPMAQGRVR